MAAYHLQERFVSECMGRNMGKEPTLCTSRCLVTLRTGSDYLPNHASGNIFFAFELQYCAGSVAAESVEKPFFE